MAKAKRSRKIPAKSAGNSARATTMARSQQTSERRQVWAYSVLLGILVLALYSPLRSYPFIDYDDPYYVTDNLHVRGGLSWETIGWSLTTMEADNWHPLTWLSHAMDCQLFGLNAGWHHITNVLIHALNVILLFLLLARVTGARGRTLIVAGLFGLHPFNVGSVAWIAERKNVLSTLFLLLTLAAYGWYARKPRGMRYALMTVLFAMGLAAKPMLVTLPFLLLILDYWPLQRVAGWSEPAEQFPVVQARAWRLFVEKLPLLALSAASSALTLLAQSGAELASTTIPYGARIANACASYFLYVWKVFWPAGFALYYPHPFAPLIPPPGITAWAAVAAGLVFLTSVSLLAWNKRRTQPYLVTGWLWYLGTLFPVIGIIQVGLQGMADRYAYVPLIGIFVIVVWGGAEIADRLGLPLAWRRALAAVTLGVLALIAFHQVGYWKSSLDLWSHTLAVTRNNYFADDRVGNVLEAARDPNALHYYEAAVKIAPAYASTHIALAEYFQDHGLLNQAVQQYGIVVRTSTDRRMIALSYINLCVIYGVLGDFGASHEAFERAVQTDQKLVDHTMQDFSENVSAHPTDIGYFGLGLLLEQSGQLVAARDAYVKALKLNPDRLSAQTSLLRLQTSGELSAPPQ